MDNILVRLLKKTSKEPFDLEKLNSCKRKDFKMCFDEIIIEKKKNVIELKRKTFD